VTGDYLEAFLDAIAAVRAAIDEDKAASRALMPQEIDLDNLQPVINCIIALRHVAAVVVINAAHAERITTGEYLDRLVRETIMEAGDPAAGGPA
jgi:hypothetical protein